MFHALVHYRYSSFNRRASYNLFEHVSVIDSSLNKNKLTQKDQSKAAALQEFLNAHAHASQYVFQVKKCSSPDCNYSQEHPVRTPENIFSNISFLPLPHLYSSKDHYQEFGSIYGQVLSEEDRPSLSQNFSSEASKIDKERKAILVNAKVQ